MGNISPTIIEAINKIGSIFYGPIAGVFLLGIYTKRGDARGALTGGLCGVIINLSLAFGLYPLSWLWWNLIGSFTTLGVGILVSSKKSKKKRIPDVNLSSLPGKQWNLVYLLIACYGTGIILFTAFIDKILF